MKTISDHTATGFSKSENRPLEDDSEKRVKPRKSSISRRSFLGKSLAVGAGTIGVGLLPSTRTARASGGLTPGDAALLRFAAAEELLEADFWIQYTSSVASRTPKSRAELATHCTPPPSRCW